MVGEQVMMRAMESEEGGWEWGVPLCCSLGDIFYTPRSLLCGWETRRGKRGEALSRELG